MTIELKKFGTTLTARQNGKEAFIGFTPTLKSVNENELVYVDFDGVNTFSPSWGDEFLTQLHYMFRERLILKKTNNPSVNTTIATLEETNNIKFSIQ